MVGQVVAAVRWATHPTAVNRYGINEPAASIGWSARTSIRRSVPACIRCYVKKILLDAGKCNRSLKVVNNLNRYLAYYNCRAASAGSVCVYHNPQVVRIADDCITGGRVGAGRALTSVYSIAPRDYSTSVVRRRTHCDSE